ncbi:RagB/SusD family nutrient uptake outer membrane protein [Flavitalea sp. BT771]|uniref:RagB/SusD family nutrient uptake outer membrane protein n=1 Tax=Flavitalea sp. BT771 TaxID=3063329 RepID=UPI0026E49326|nr:RagB/SusD family nutrient uptake outer membrane protein [Flavitalea sp. BT771]MDO6431054.1 RagB/SusD family nutrient uptake outer membrane protein [Flavitalea sp. BT771]MDV6219961.1 RagB/SusD family nutrient uptake outer membrane protein [Flavitalea sp. BT771]
MKTIVKILLTVSLPVAMLSSCKKYLNVVPDDVATLESAFVNANETQAYLFGCYSTLQNLSDVRRNAGFTTSGEIIFPYPLQDQSILGGPGGDDGFQILRGTQNSANPILNYWDGYNMGLNLWQAIRRCNTLIANINIPQDLPAYNKTRWVAEAKFLKAYYHYWLIRQYGPIPIVDVSPSVDATTEQVRVKQQTVDSCFNYVVGLLDQAAADLPAVIQNTALEAGRITSTIALAVKAEVLATQASPLFNGNPDYLAMKGKDGTSFFPATYDPGKWQKALAATKAAIDAANAANASLYSLKLTGNIAHLTDSVRQLLTIQGAFVDPWNQEQIWTLNPQFGWQYMASPRVTADAAANVFAVYSNFSVPIAESELFYTDHGVPIAEDKTWDYAGRYAVQYGDQSHYYYLRNNYPTAKGNFHREPRYYADVSFDGANWFGSGNTDDRNMNYVNAVNGFAAPPDKLRYNTTGYWAKKLVPYQSTAGQSSVWQGYSWPFMRVSGLWLLYAECLNEVNGPSAEVYSWIDKVRARAGLQGVVDSWNNYSINAGKPSTKDGLRSIIHQERRIELSFEGQAGWDLRRWKELQSVLTGPVQGWNVFNKTVNGYYQVVNVFQPIFGLRNYFYPIQDYDILTNPNLTQTLYW